MTVKIEAGVMVLHALGPCGRVVKVWDPGTYTSPEDPEGPPFSCVIMELARGDTLVLDEETAGNFTVLSDDLALAYKSVLVPSCAVVLANVAEYVGRRVNASERSAVLVTRMLTAALNEAIRKAAK